MRRGDLVQYEGAYWMVRVYDPRRTKLAVLLGADGATLEVPPDAPVTNLGNPSVDWPFVTGPEKPRWGVVSSVLLIKSGKVTPLIAFQDYLFADPQRCGGSLFLRPGLAQVGDILQMRYGADGVNGVNVSIPSGFATVAARVAKAAAKPPTVQSVYDRLSDDSRERFDE